MTRQRLVWLRTGALALIAGIIFAAAVQGWLLGRLGWAARGALLVAALSLIKPGLATDLVGFVLLALVAAPQLLARARARRPGGLLKDARAG